MRRKRVYSDGVHRNKWTAEEDSVLVALRREGKPYKVIAKRLNRSIDACTARAIVVGIAERKKRRLTNEDKAAICDLHAQGLTDKQIGIRLQLSHTAVWRYRSRSGLPSNAKFPWNKKD